MVDFYTQTLGLTLKRTFEVSSEGFGKGVGIPGAKARGAHITDAAGQVELELLEFINHSTEVSTSVTLATNESGYRHIAFIVDDLQKSYERLKTKGAEFLSEPVTMTIPENIAGFSFVYFRDPEGNIIELNRLPEGA